MIERIEFKLNELNKHLLQLKRNIKYLDAFYGFPLKDKLPRFEKIFNELKERVESISRN